MKWFFLGFQFIVSFVFASQFSDVASIVSIPRGFSIKWWHVSKTCPNSEKLLNKMPQIRIQVERNVAKEFWSFKKEWNLVIFSPKIGNMQPI